MTVRLGFNAIATTIIISMYRNINNGSFIHLETYIVFWLVITLPVIAVAGLGSLEMERYLKRSKEVEDALVSGKESELEAKREAEMDTSKSSWSWEKWRKIYNSTPHGLRDLAGVGWFLILEAFALGTQLWVLFFGLYRGHNPDCKARIFLYGNIDLYSQPWVIFSKVISVCNVIPAVACLLLGLCFLLLGILFSAMASGDSTERSPIAKSTNAPDKGKEPSENPTTEPTQQQLEVQGQRIKDAQEVVNARYWKLILYIISRTIASLIIAAVGIAFIERTIIINNIDLRQAPLSSSGQLLAFMVALLTSIPVFWGSACQLFREIKEGRRKNTNYNEQFQAIQRASMQVIANTGERLGKMFRSQNTAGPSDPES
jgi:hypothetical protein